MKEMYVGISEWKERCVVVGNDRLSLLVGRPPVLVYELC